MRATTKWWLAAPLAIGLIVAACGGDDSSDDDEAAAEAPASAAAAAEDEIAQEETTEQGGDTTASIMLGDEEIAVERTLCYFEEQKRAGLGGVWTHTTQVTGTTAAGEPVILAFDRARNEDDTVEDSIHVDIGDFTAEDAVSMSASGPEGLIEFGDSSVSVQDVEVVKFGSDPVTLSARFDC